MSHLLEIKFDGLTVREYQERRRREELLQILNSFAALTQEEFAEKVKFKNTAETAVNDDQTKPDT